MQKSKSKYKSSGEWKRANPSAYATAQANGLLDKICEHFGWNKNNFTGYWTLEKCKEDALKYKTRNEWQTAKKSGYHSAKKNGWREECCKHMISPLKQPGYWDFNACKKSALKYKTKSSWKKNEGSAVNSAMKNGWFDELTSHMVELHKPKDYWTKEKCKEDALNYKYRTQWKKGHNHVYNIACKNGWIDECCEHMK